MLKVITILFKYLRAEAQYEFMVLFGNLIQAYPAVKTLLGTMVDNFAALLAVEAKLVDAQRISIYTAEIAEADKRDDRLVTGIREIIIASMRHFDDKVVQAATALYDRIKIFGNIDAKSYREEAAALRLLLADLTGKFSTEVATVGISNWVYELSLAFADFERLLKLRDDEEAKLPQERLKDVRREIEALYHVMIKHISAAALLDTTDLYTEFIAKLNVEVTYFNDHNHHPAPKDLKKAVVDTVPEQIYTGREITPLPVVHLNDTELVFAKDYFLTYKNNTDPGTATLNIHGKGAYKGRKSVTFNILEHA
jgi:hypothetical protein